MAKKDASKSSPQDENPTLPDSSVFELPAQVDISSSVAFFENIRAAYTSNNITFNASKVDRFTTPAVQILLATAASAKLKGGRITIVEPSESFTKSITELGFSEQLKEWMDNNV